jgi:hypothetical protein
LLSENENRLIQIPLFFYPKFSRANISSLKKKKKLIPCPKFSHQPNQTNKEIENSKRLHLLTSNCLCTIRGLFFGLLGGLAPTIFRKSSSTSSFNRETANFTFSFVFAFTATAQSPFFGDEELDSIFLSSL